MVTVNLREAPLFSLYIEAAVLYEAAQRHLERGRREGYLQPETGLGGAVKIYRDRIRQRVRSLMDAGETVSAEQALSILNNPTAHREEPTAQGRAPRSHGLKPLPSLDTIEPWYEDPLPDVFYNGIHRWPDLQRGVRDYRKIHRRDGEPRVTWRRLAAVVGVTGTCIIVLQRNNPYLNAYHRYESECEVISLFCYNSLSKEGRPSEVVARRIARVVNGDEERFAGIRKQTPVKKPKP